MYHYQHQDMLDIARGEVTCQAANFIKTFREIPDGSFQLVGFGITLNNMFVQHHVRVYCKRRMLAHLSLGS